MPANVIHEADLARVLAHANRQQHVMLLLSHRAGLRAMEIAALDWRHCLDAAGGIADAIDLPALATKNRTGQGRIPVASDLKAALLKLAAQHRHPRRGRVIVGDRGPLSAHAVGQRLNRLYERNGLDASSHSGRRTYATRLSGKGLNAFQLQRAMRHADISTTRKYVDDAASDALVVEAIHSLA